MNVSSPLLSIIVPVYNVEKYLAACIESVLKQEYSNWELLLMNDGSTDNSLAICYEYAQQDKRIRVYSHENRGQSGTQNRALDLITGELVAFLDSDDEIEPVTYVAAIQKLLASPMCDLVQFPSRCFHVSYGIIENSVIDKDIIGASNMYDAWLRDARIGWTSWCKIYKRSLFDGLRFKEKILFEDNLMTACILARARGICFSPKGAYRFYVRTEQKIQWDERRRRDQMTSWVETIHMLDEYGAQFRAARAEFVRRVGNALYVDVKKYARNDETVLQARTTIKNFPFRDIWGGNRLNLKSKVKLLGLKLWAMFL